MAEAVLFNIAGGIIKKLGSRAILEIGQWWNLEDELEKLKDTVSTIQAVLLDAEKQCSENQQVKVWLQRLKQAIYDADDLLDDFSAEALWQQSMSEDKKSANQVRFSFPSLNRLPYGYKMARKIKNIREKLDYIKGDRGFHLDECREEKSIMFRDREQTHSSLPEIVVGRDDDKNTIIENLLLSTDKKENLSVISIVGIGGLGKTTLAQFLYSDERVKTHFELRGWVCVSNDFNVKLITEKILESMTSGRCDNLGMDATKNNFHEKINGRRYIIVLDDVWNEDVEKWFRLRDVLAGGAKESKIIITTRSKKVAKITRSTLVHELKGLSEAESWSLFEKIAFDQRQVPSSSQEAIGKEIVAKCVGVPLAIRTIGGLLYCKNTVSEWLFFRNNELPKVQEDNILSTLKLSYDNLPSYLKHCFAYCSIFPKDYEISVQKLIYLWMAQGYIELSDPSQSLEETGLIYFRDLLSMSFFQEVTKDKWGNIKTCKMHDLIHDLAKLVAGEESITLSVSNVASVGKTTRHIFQYAYNYEYEKQLPSNFFNAKKVRTLLLHNHYKLWCEDTVDYDPGNYLLLVSKSKYLRALDLGEQSKVPDSIFGLKHLRYLDLSYNDRLRKLPSSISRLQNLQVLILDHCSSLEGLPKDIEKLVDLRKLSFYNCYPIRDMPLGIEKLTRLERLTAFLLGRDGSASKPISGLDALRNMNNLRGELTIKYLRYVLKNDALDEFCAANLKEKRYLQSLSLEWIPLHCLYNDDEDDKDKIDAKDLNNEEMALEELRPHQNLKGLHLSGYRGVKYPSWLPFLTNLLELHISCCRNIQFLPTFDHFPFLESLRISKLSNLEYIDCEVDSNNGGFPSLKELWLSDCSSLKGWKRLSSIAMLPKVFNCLSKLSIFSCPNLTSMPLFPSLQTLELADATIKQLEQTLKMTNSARDYSSSSPSSSSSSSPFPAAHSQLEQLFLKNIKDLELMPAELLHSLTSLEVMSISDCPRIVPVSTDVRDIGGEWQALKSLRSLELNSIPELVCLPEGLQHITTLQSLAIGRCHNLLSLPEWIANLTKLQSLRVFACHSLSEKCRQKTGEYLPKFAHIPNLDFRPYDHRPRPR